MKYAHIDENNMILGWHDKEIHKSIPTPNIEVTDEVWENAINNGHNKIVDGITIRLEIQQVPQSITPVQFREMLRLLGLYARAKELANSSENIEIMFEYSLEFNRDNLTLVQFAKDNFAMSDENIDSFFINASKL